LRDFNNSVINRGGGGGAEVHSNCSEEYMESGMYGNYLKVEVLHSCHTFHILATIGCTVCTFSQLYCMHLAVECGVSYWILYYSLGAYFTSPT